MEMKCLTPCVILTFLIVFLISSSIPKKYTFTLSNDKGTIMAEQIQPLLGTVKVSGDSDVVFTDVETEEQYLIGYITHGATKQ